MLRLALSSAAPRQVIGAVARRSLSSKPSGPVAIKQTLPKNASIGMAVAGLAVLLAAGSGGSAKADADAASAARQAEEAKQIDELIVSLNKRLDSLEKLIEEDRASRELAKRLKEEEDARKEAEAKAAKEAEDKKAADEAEKQAVIDTACATNRAFIFIKPHANTEKVEALVKETLAKQGFNVKAEGVLTAEEIDSKKLIDIHYGAIAGKAVLQKPAELNVPAKGKGQFEEAFGLSWENALNSGSVLNAADACAKLNVDGDELEKLWRKIDKKHLIKFGGGFYCGQVQPGLYVINGFYMQMRGKYTRPPASIKYFEVEWTPANLPWKAFREQFLGSTDPSKAAESSLRRQIYDKWQELGLPAQPDTGDNGMHGSASPFEALAEVSNWEGKSISEDAFGKGLLAASGLDEATLKTWLGDAQVPVDGKPTSIFDTLEDQDSKENIEKVKEIVSTLATKTA